MWTRSTTWYFCIFILAKKVQKHVLNAIFYCYTFLYSKWYLQLSSGNFFPISISVFCRFRLDLPVQYVHTAFLWNSGSGTFHSASSFEPTHKLSRMQPWIFDFISALLLSGQFSAFSFEETRWHPELNWKSRGCGFLSCVLFLWLFILFSSLDVGPLKSIRRRPDSWHRSFLCSVMNRRSLEKICLIKIALTCSVRVCVWVCVWAYQSFYGCFYT